MVNHWILMEEATSVVTTRVHSFSKCFHLITLTYILTHHAPGNFSILQPWLTPPHIFSFLSEGVHLPSFQSLSITLWNPFGIVRIPFHLKPMFKAHFTFDCFRNLILPQPLQVLLP